VVKNQVIDGFIKAPSRTQTVKNSTAPQQSPRQNSSMTPRTKSSPEANGLHNRAERAHTLMRGALKKPSGSFSARIQTLTPGHNPQREFRAKKIIKHSQVERFGSPSAPAAAPAKQVIHGEVSRRHQTAGNQTINTKGTAALALPSMVTSASHQKLERMLDAALTHADAHKQALKYHAARHFWQRPGFLGKRPLLKITAAVVILLGAGIYFAWQKLPILSVKLAGAQAHIRASVPSYKPDGYSLAAPASTQAGAVVIKYKAPGSSQGFDIAQKSSAMTSTGLAQSVVPANTAVQTSQVDGNTVYIYGASNNAAWVNNGVLYTITDHSKLTSDQIINIVRGLN
jgi:hypothetical protein